MSSIFPFPVLHNESLDYEDPQAYLAEPSRRKNEIIVKHKLKNNNLVADMVLQQDATFFTMVAVRGTIFRKTYTLENMFNNPNTEQSQEIKSQQNMTIPNFRNKPDVFVNCGVVMSKETDRDAQQAKGVSKFFHDTGKIVFPQHAIIAFSGWTRFFSMGSLFRIVVAKYDAGLFNVELDYSNTFRIVIRVGNKLYENIVNNRTGPTRNHVLCVALTVAFTELKQSNDQLENNTEDSNELEEKKLELAEGLKLYLQSKGILSWEDAEFNPAYAASIIYSAMVDDEDGAE